MALNSQFAINITTTTTTTTDDDDYLKFYNNNNSSNSNNNSNSSNFSIKNGNIDISTNLSQLLDATASAIIQNSTTVGPTESATVAQQQSTTTATSISSFLSTTANTLTSLNSNSNSNNNNNEIFNDNNNNTNSFNPIYYQLKNSSDYNNEILTDYNNSSQNFLVNDFSQDNNSSNNNSVNNFNINDSAKLSYESGSNFMLLLEDFGEYFYNYNGSDFNSTSTIPYPANCSLNSTSCGEENITQYNYWALILILFPFLTLFGNVLVILAVCRERTLQTVTNYFIVSLAIADLLVAVVVMPFGVYILVNGAWSLPNVVCDFYIAMDVICSTSSIFNLVAISIDRYIAVTQPIKYAKHKNSRRVCLTILLVWAISAAIGSPIVLGLNNTPDRVPDLCLFYNSDFIVYSSLSSFYIPCIIMVFLYWNIFKALRIRAKKQRAARKPHISDLATSGSVIENVAQTKKLAETIIDGKNKNGAKILPDDDRPTNTGSGSNEDDDVGSPDGDDCHVIVNDKSTDFMLATVVEETSNVMAQIATTQSDPNGNPDSGYAPSHIIDDILPSSCSPTGSPHHATIFVNRNVQYKSKNGSSSKHTTLSSASPLKEPFSASIKPISVVHCDAQGLTIARNDSTLSTNSRDSSRKDSKNIQASRFTIYKVNKASKKKREKSSAKKERKATKTLAIVLGVFLICWVPFFTCNIMDAMCTKMNMDCQPGITAFILTTWLGYMNSFVNPVIYTIFNPEFRKAFKKIMHMA